MSSNLFSYILLITYVPYYIVFVSHCIFFCLSCYFTEHIYLTWVSVSVSSSSPNIVAVSTKTNLLKYFPNISFLVFSWSTTYKKLERTESNLSGKWAKCTWTKKPHDWRHLYQTVGALVMYPGRVHALIKQIKQWDFELVHSGNNFYWHAQWVTWYFLRTNAEQHFHAHKQGAFAKQTHDTHWDLRI